MKKKRQVSKTSLYLPDEIIKAMRAVKEKELINQSHQVELALRIYLKTKGVALSR